MIAGWLAEIFAAGPDLILTAPTRNCKVGISSDKNIMQCSIGSPTLYNYTSSTGLKLITHASNVLAADHELFKTSLEGVNVNVNIFKRHAF